MKRLLVANRGEIARRVFETAHGRGLDTVAVYVDADADSPHVTEATEAVRLPDGGYLDAAALVEAARRTDADAIHPGYGFLSENADFARAVIDAGITWVGPTPEVITQMGDKLAAKRAAADADVPTLPSTEDPSAAGELGYPLLVKAAAGGGGKGMRVVDAPDDLDEAVASARREAAAGFGDDTVFVEHYVARSRHVEVQIVGDAAGTVVHLGERECSIQRRHQKIVEESPSPGIDDDQREAITAAAVRLGEHLGYTNAGTVEFLVDEDSGEFWFLEVNTRLQVEHPVTEESRWVDLVDLQLDVADGGALDPELSEPGALEHAIEVRLYAEDPATGFLPATGPVDAFVPADGARFDMGVETGSEVTTGFDPMIGKVIVSAETREAAAEALARALERMHLGGLTTNRDFLVHVLRSGAFLAGDTTTDFIERVQPAPTLALEEDERVRAAATAALWLQGRNRVDATVQEHMPSGWRVGRLPAERVSLALGGEPLDVHYRRTRDGSFEVWTTAGGAPPEAEPPPARRAVVHGWTPTSVDVEIDGRRFAGPVTGIDDRLHVQTRRGTVSFTVVPRFSPPEVEGPVGGLVAPMPGQILEVRVTEGAPVTEGQVLVVMEAMKMEQHVKAPHAGVVADVRVAEGDQVENGAALLIVAEPEDE